MPASFHRERLRQALADSSPEVPLPGQRSAAIALVLLEVDANLEVLLIERAERSGDPWSGHMALLQSAKHSKKSASICGAPASGWAVYRTQLLSGVWPSESGHSCICCRLGPSSR